MLYVLPLSIALLSVIVIVWIFRIARSGVTIAAAPLLSVVFVVAFVLGIGSIGFAMGARFAALIPH